MATLRRARTVACPARARPRAPPRARPGTPWLPGVRHGVRRRAEGGAGERFSIVAPPFAAAPHPSPSTGQRRARSQNALHGSAQTRADFCAPCIAVSRASPLGFSSPHPHEVEHVPVFALDILCPPPCSRTTIRARVVAPQQLARLAFFRPHSEARAFSAHHQFANDALKIQKLLTMRRALRARLDGQLART